MAKAAWDASNAEEIAMNGGKVARWNDFRVTPGLTGFGELQAVQFRQGTLSQISFIAGQFNNSQVVDTAGVTRTFSLGDTTPATQYGIIDEYDNQEGTSDDPENPSTSPYNGLLPNQDPAAAQAISEFGSEPPYNGTGYGRGVWVKVGTIHLASGRQRLSTGFFKAPLGLIAMTGVGWLTNPDITVEVKAGDYKGVMSHSMLE